MKALTELTSREIASIKRIFLNNLPMYKKIDSIDKKIEELTKEKEDLNTFIESSENGVKNLTGYTSGQLIKCDYIPQVNEDGTPKMDKDNKYQLKKRVLTFVVPVEEVNESESSVESIVDNVEPVDITNTTESTESTSSIDNVENSTEEKVFPENLD